jgi:transcriptional regulator with XRE-family HTH domain
MATEGAGRLTLALDQLAARVARSVRAHREARGWSLATLAGRAGLSKTIIARIEAGAGNPSLETLLRLADALGVTLGTLIAEEEHGREPVVTRVAAAEYVISESGLKSRPLRSDGRGRRVDTYELVLVPRVDYRSRPHPAGTEELVVCIDRSLEVGPVGQEALLGERDALHFSADVPHRYRSEGGAVALCIMSFPAPLGDGS